MASLGWNIYTELELRPRSNDLRHTFGSNLASEGVSLIEIRDALGHTSTRTTERYAKPDGRSLERDARSAQRPSAARPEQNQQTQAASRNRKPECYAGPSP
jgi:integrase